MWEEVIIHLPADGAPGVPVGHGVERRASSPTWITTVRGPDRPRSSRSERPVELAEPLHGRRPGAPSSCTCCRRCVDGRPNPEASRLDARRPRRDRGSRGPARRRQLVHAPARSRSSTCSRPSDMLPAIYFIFSRAGCDEAADALPRRRRCGSPTPEERDRDPRRSSSAHGRAPRPTATSPCSATAAWLAGLEAGVAAHHAGMVPPFKEAVEACFVAGPRQGGVRHRDAGARHQHAGPHGRDREADQVHRRAPRVPDAGRVHPAHRAGRAAGHRRPSGYAVVLWSPFVALRPGRRPGRRAARSRSRSAFRPDLQHGGQPRAAATRPTRPTTCSTCRSPSTRPTATVVRIETRLARRETALAEAREEAQCDRGDIDSYRALVLATERTSAGVDDPGRSRGQPRSQVELAMSRLRPGDVIQQPGSNADADYAVLTVARRKGGTVRLRGAHQAGPGGEPGEQRLRRSARGRGEGRPAGALRCRTTAASSRRSPTSCGSCRSHARAAGSIRRPVPRPATVGRDGPAGARPTPSRYPWRSVRLPAAMRPVRPAPPLARPAPRRCGGRGGGGGTPWDVGDGAPA